MSQTQASFRFTGKTGLRLQNLPRILLAPIPIFSFQPILTRIVTSVAYNRPALFSRLGVHKDSVYLIDLMNTPFILTLYPNPDTPRLTAYRRKTNVPYDARITGSFLTLLRMIDGQLDGDALFFSRDLKVEGNTEAIVCLRNAIDDLDGSILDDILNACEPFSKILNRALTIIRNRKHSS